MRSDDEPFHEANRKVMIYVPATLHLAVKRVALDDGRSASDVYAEAARALLAARGVDIEPPRPASPPPPSPDLADLTVAFDKLIARIDDALEERLPKPADEEAGGRLPTGTKVADAMAALLAVLGKAGEVGIASADLTSAMYQAKIKSGTAEIARVALRTAGLIRRDGKRWFAVEASAAVEHH